MTVENALNLGIVVLFAPRDIACELTRNVVELYNKIKDKPRKLEYTLYSVIAAMIDAYFDDEDEDEVMKMINNETAEDIVGKFETEIISQNRINVWKEEADNANARADKSEVRADEAEVRANKADAEVIQLKAKIKELEKQLNNK